MKKIFFFASALAGLFFAASCQQENLEPVGGNTVTITVEAPGAMNTKAIADGTNVNEVHYAVYKTNSGEDYSIDDSGAITGPLAQGVVEMSNKRASIDFDLLQDQEYTVIFWAQVAGAGHYTLGDLRTITIDDAVVDGNDETRAAFFARFDFSTFEHEDHTVTLRRPFAQLNLLTTKESLTPVQSGQTSSYAIDVETSEVKVIGLGTSFNTLTGVAPAEDATIVYEMAATPAKQGQETLTVNGKEYHYVSMNYLFVPEEEKLVDIQYNIATDKGTMAHEIVAVPVKENYRTNVIGNLLTKETKFEIIVDAEFEAPKNAPEQIVAGTIDDLQYALDNAIVGDNTIFLGNDMAGDVWVHQKSGVNIELIGQDRIFDGTIRIHNGSNYNDATFTVKGVNFKTSTESLNFIMPNDFDRVDGVTRRYSNNVTVENCTFTAEGAAVNTAVGVQAKSCKNLQVIGCTATDMHSLLQAQSCGADVIVKDATINGKNGVAFKQVKNAVVEGAVINAAAYGIRFDGNIDNYGVTVKDCNVTAVQPVIVRKMTGKNNTIAFEGANTFVTEETFQVVITKGSDDEAYSYPTGTYTLTGNEGLNVYPIVNAESFAAAVANEKLPVVEVIAPIENVGEGFSVTRDVILNMNNKEFNAGSTANSYWYALQISGDNNVEINDANFTRAGIYSAQGANVVFNSGVINHKPERTSRYIFCAQSGSTITINEGTFTNDRANNSYFWADNATIYVKGGNFGGVASKSKVVLSNGGQVIISGGTFNFDPTAWLKVGYTAVKNGSVWSVVPADQDAYVSNADGTAAAYSQAGFAAAINEGKLEIALTEGTYSLAKVPAGLKLVGLEDNVVLDMKGKAAGVNGAITMENITIEFSNANYKGFQHTSTEYYKDCTIVGQPFLYGENVTFDGCTFEQSSADAYNVWTYGAKNVTFNECTFNSAGKSVLVYAESASTGSVVTFNNSVLNASAPVEGKAAVEIDSSLIKGQYVVNFNNTTANGFANGNVSGNSLWNNKKGTKAQVFVEGTQVL